MEQDNSAFNQSEELDQARSENFRLDNDPQEPPSLTEGGFLSVINNHEIVPSEKGVVKNDRPPKPKHYFDVFTGSVIDRKFYKYFERSGINPENIIDLGLLLRETQVPKRPLSYRKLDPTKTANKLLDSLDTNTDKTEKYTQRRFWSWSEDRYKRFGRWLYKAAAPPNNTKESQLNEAIFYQAYALGLGPGGTIFQDKFGSLSKFYESLKIDKVHQIGTFDDWTSEDFIKYLKNVGRNIEGKPTLPILWDYSRKNPHKNPSPAVIASRIGGGKKIGPAIELAGYFDIYNWTDDDYLDWGTKLMKANNGLEISTHILNYLSLVDKGPTASTIKNRFGINNFKERVNHLYRSELEAESERKIQKIAEIDAGLKNEKIPRELFETAETEDDLILIYSKFIVVHHLCPEWDESTKIIVSTRGFQDAGLIRSIRKINNAINAGDVESAALYLDVFDIIWPLNCYIEALKLGDDYSRFYSQFRVKENKRQSVNRSNAKEKYRIKSRSK
jgi:hypothetical protein